MCVRHSLENPCVPVFMRFVSVEFFMKFSRYHIMIFFLRYLVFDITRKV